MYKRQRFSQSTGNGTLKYNLTNVHHLQVPACSSSFFVSSRDASGRAVSSASLTKTAKNVIKNTNNTTQSVEKSLLSNWVTSSNDRPFSSFRESITSLLVNCVALDLQPLSFGKDSGMRALLQYMKPNYVPPTGTTLQKHLMKRCKTLHDEILSKLKNAKDCSCTCNTWTNIQMDGFF